MELHFSRGQLAKKEIPFPSFGDFLCNSLHGDSLLPMEEPLARDTDVSEVTVCFFFFVLGAVSMFLRAVDLKLA